mmetsp:Transcript_6533/g.27174  ORF Transcript_6533/g.27174 Transcript_6533/m.27174 type:complete len:258 (-) Transcript_6533:57-830(-)
MTLGDVTRGLNQSSASHASHGRHRPSPLRLEELLDVVRLEQRHPDEHGRVQNAETHHPPGDGIRRPPVRRLPVLLVDHLRSELVVHLPHRVQGHPQLVDVGVGGGVVCPVMPHVDVPVQRVRVPLVVGEAEFVRAIAVGVELELVLVAVLEAVHDRPVLVLHDHVEDVRAVRPSRTVLHLVEGPDESVARVISVQVEALLVVAADGHLQRIGRSHETGEDQHRERDRRPSDSAPAPERAAARASRRLDRGAGHLPRR